MQRAFTLVETLVVFGIISVLLAVLLPALGFARSQAYRTACLSNSRQLGFAELMYEQDHDDVLVPMITTIYAPPYQDLRDLWYSKLHPYTRSGQLASGGLTGDYVATVMRCHEDNSTLQSATASFSLNVSYGFNYDYLANRNSDSDTDPALSVPLNSSVLTRPSETVIFGESYGWVAKITPPYYDAWWDGVSLTNPQTNMAAGSTWERPQRHAGSANYTFTDGHSRAIRQSLIYPVSATGISECYATREYFHAFPGQLDESWAGCNDLPSIESQLGR